MKYNALHVHSEYSILDSTLSIKEIVDAAKKFEMSHVALTDFGNMYGAIDFYKESKKAGIQPIIGTEIMVAPRSLKEKKKVIGEPAGWPIILLAKDREGYEHLCKLTSIASLEGFYYYPRIDHEILKTYGSGLICLSGPYYGKIGTLAAQEKLEELKEELTFYKSIFGEDFYFEISRHRMSDEAITHDKINDEPWLLQKMQDAFSKQEKIIEVLHSISKREGIQLVATNDVHYKEREDWQAHEILTNISSGEPCEIWEKDAFGNLKNKILNPKRQTAHSHELYFKSSDEMSELFKDFPDALQTTIEISKKCNLEFDFTKKFYPVFVPPELEGKDWNHEYRMNEAAKYLKKLCEEGIKTRYQEKHLAKVQEKYPDKDPMDVVKERLTYELDIIISKGMCDYLLIVHDFISWAKNQKIPMGPGRGSGAGSIILYLIGITDIEPLRFNLFFERFINPERISYPDIDVDICMERRSEVIDYTIKKYGKDKVAQIITFGTMKAKMAIKDVGRVLSIPLAKVNMIAKLVPEDLSITIEKALDVDPDLRELYDEDEETRRILDIARKVEGSIRNTGIHAAGIIICGDPLTDHIPVCSAKDSSDIVVTQYSMKPVEMVGMLKIDFLGLKTLTCIQKAVDAVSEHLGKKIPWIDLPLDDEKTFALLNQGKTLGVFQLESTGMQDLARQLHIDKFEEIIAVGALYRPGPMEMIPSFIQRKHGKEAIEYDHEWLKDILAETYGIMVYQEQVMQMASKLAGYSLGEGDVLRRAMGKKDHEEMQRQKGKFCQGATEKGIDEKTAVLIFDKVEKFASYGFNKSHAAAYGYLSYVTAYLKANYPGEWMAALMTCDLSDLTKVAKHIRESQSMGLPILPPDINESDLVFVATPKGIRFALAAIKGIGEGVVEQIIQERKNGGIFVSLLDFLQRVDISILGKKTIECLIQAGCFDFTSWSRDELVVSLHEHFESIVKEKKEKEKGILDFFGGSGKGTTTTVERPKVISQHSKLEILSLEKQLLGFYVTGHPLDEYRETLKQLECLSLDEVENISDKGLMKVAFVVDTLQVKISQKTQKKFALLTISTGGERYELPIWPELYEKKGHLLEDNALLYGIVQIDKQEDAPKLSAKWLGNLKEVGNLEEFHEAFKQAELVAKSDQKKQKRKPQSEEIPAAKGVKMRINIDKITLDKICLLKEILHEFAGGNKLDLIFEKEAKSVGVVTIDASFGINPTEEFQKKILSLPYTIDLILE